MTKNRLYCGENIEILPTMEAESVPDDDYTRTVQDFVTACRCLG